MGVQRGGRRDGAGRKKGSKNKTTIAREVIGEIIDAPDPMKLASAIHHRGHAIIAVMPCCWNWSASCSTDRTP